MKPATGQTPFLRPHQAAVANNNSYWVADTGNNRIVRVDAAGAVLQNWNNGATIKGPRGIAVDANGDVYVANSGNNRIEKYNPSGTRLAVAARTTAPDKDRSRTRTGCGSWGRARTRSCWWPIAGNNRIVVLKLDGTFVTSFGALGTGNGQFTQPQGVAQNPLNGDLAVADFGNNRLSVWATTP